MPHHEKKPWYRTRNIILGVLVLGLVVIGSELFRSTTATPSRAVNYLEVYRDRLEAQLPPGPDGWVHLETAVNAYDGVIQTARGEPEPIDWPESVNWPAAFELVREGAEEPVVVARTMEISARLEASGVLEALDRLAASPRAMRPISTEGRMIDILLPELGMMRGITRWETMLMSQAAASGDWDTVVRTLEHSLALTRVCTRQGTLIEHLVGHAIMALALSELRTAVATHEPDAETIDRLLAVIERQTPMNEIALAIDSERLMVMDMIQATHTDDGDGSGRLLLSEFSSYAASVGMGMPRNPLMGSKLSNIAGIVFPSRAETTQKANDYYDRCIEWSRQTRLERVANPFDPDTWVMSELGWGDLVLRQLLPAIGKAASTADRAKMQLRGTRLMLAIERHRHEHGAYPATLSELDVDGTDLVDPHAGGPFGYRVLSAQTPNGYELIAHVEDAYMPEPGAGGEPVVVEMDELAADLGTRLNLRRAPD